ncbi:hypothetical protein JCM8547_005964 [Rhodosporidiobolus lusitaniae]
MLLKLNSNDAMVERVDIAGCYVFQRAASSASEVEDGDLVNRFKGAADRVVRKWPLLAGVPSKGKDGHWSINIPDDIHEHSKTRPLFGFTTALHHQPYYLATGLPAPLPPLSSSSSGFLPSLKLSLFRPPSAPKTLFDHERLQSPLLHIHLGFFSDAVAVSVTVPHGVFDGKGAGMVNEALNAELRGESDSWTAPALWEGENPFFRTFEDLADDEVFAEGRETVPVTRGWIGSEWTMAIPRALLGAIWESQWWKSEMRWLVIRKETVEALVERVKGEVRGETEGKEYVSTGDVLMAWVLPAAHSDETTGSFTAAPLYNCRQMLNSYNPSFSLDYPHNAAVPYDLLPTKPIPLSTLRQTPLSSLSLLFRRSILTFRSLPALSRFWQHYRANSSAKSPMLPYRDWPELPWFLRWLWLPSWFSRSSGAGHCTRWMVSDQRELGMGALSLPGKDGKPLPLLSYQLADSSPGHLDHVLGIQRTAEGDYTISAHMRRSRWESVERRLKELERGVTKQ